MTAERLARARTVLADTGTDALLVSVGSDLPYLVGYRAMVSERLTMLVLTASEAVLVVPELEAARVVPGPFEIRAWGETEDPIRIVASLLGAAQSAAIGDQTWSTFLVRLQEAAPAVRFRSAGPLMRTLRIRKDREEIEALRTAAAGVDRVVAELATMRFSATTERALARTVAEMTLAAGHETSEFAIVASGPNGASPHHEPGERRIEPGDLVVVDFGGRARGYCSDTTRTFAVGEPPPDAHEAYEVLRAAQAAAVAAVRPGIRAADIDRTARSIIADAGYGERFIHRTGHGIGMDVHEDPYLVEGNDELLAPGMAFSVEPGIYTAGEWGMRIEDIVAVGEAGVDRLNRSDRHLSIVT